MWKPDPSTPFVAIRNPNLPRVWKVTFRFVNDDDTSLEYSFNDSASGAGVMIKGGIASLTEPHVSSQDNFPKIAADWIAQYNAMEAQANAPLSPIVFWSAVEAYTQPAAQTEPTKDEIAIQVFRQAQEAQRHVAQLVADGILTPDDDRVHAASAAIETAKEKAAPVLLAKADDVLAALDEANKAESVDVIAPMK